MMIYLQPVQTILKVTINPSAIRMREPQAPTRFGICYLQPRFVHSARRSRGKSCEFLHEPQGLLGTSRTVSDSGEYSKREFFDRFPAFLLVVLVRSAAAPCVSRLIGKPC